MSSLRLILLLTATMALAACNRVHVGGDDGGASDGGSREQCGPATCAVGQVCCNSSCGICTDPGGSCITLACVNDCQTNADCGGNEYCAFQGCPSGGNSGTCVPRPEACDLLLDPVCGCDGRDYGNACAAASNGMNVASLGECGGSCGADDAVGVGPCDAIVGTVWNGSTCGEISGCSCQGSDCGRYGGPNPREECLREHSSCIGCAPDDARGVGGCATVLGIVWDGITCTGLSGCSCDGADCNRWLTTEDCQAAHSSCTGGCGTDADCPSGEWCRFDSVGQCTTGSGGTCAGTPPPGWACDGAEQPVCGCDGNTYQCDNHAWAFMTSVLHEGPCGGGVCAAQDARGVDPECPAILGVAWNGASCDHIGGCGCEGTDCMNLYRTIEDCQAATAGCAQPPGGNCGGFAETPCRPDEWCDYPAGSFCGGDDSPGVCRLRPEICNDILAPVCGCDGRDYDNECTANGAGVDISSNGGCIVPG